MIGERRLRKEDARFLTGRGRYLADHHVDGLHHVALLRSPAAHAVIRRHRHDGGGVAPRGGGRVHADRPRRRRVPTHGSPPRAAGHATAGVDGAGVGSGALRGRTDRRGGGGEPRRRRGRTRARGPRPGDLARGRRSGPCPRARRAAALPGVGHERAAPPRGRDPGSDGRDRRRAARPAGALREPSHHGAPARGPRRAGRVRRRVRRPARWSCRRSSRTSCARWWPRCAG